MFKGHLPQLVAAQVDMGHKVVPYTIGTMKGKRAGSVAYAESKTHRLVEFRGGLAERVYPVYQHVTSKATRIDYALTLWLESYQRDVAEQVYDVATRYMVERGWNHVRKMPVLITSADGDTCYLGSRSSERYVRVYDKGRQSNDEEYTNAWRFEVEFKGQTAQILWQGIQHMPDAAPHIQTEVLATVGGHGVVLRGFDEQVRATKVPYDKTPADVTSRLQWLQSQVRPAIEDLTKRGFRQAALACLGIIEADEPNESE